MLHSLGSNVDLSWQIRQLGIMQMAQLWPKDNQSAEKIHGKD